MSVRSTFRALLMFVSAALVGVVRSDAQVSPILVDQDQLLDSMSSDRFTWIDSSGQPRVAVLAHDNIGVANPDAGGAKVYGSALREFRYHLPDGSTRIAKFTLYGGGAFGGFGYVVDHSNAGSCIGDDSPLGDYTQITSFQRVFLGRHHAIFRFKQNYPRNCPVLARTLPVTIDWIFMTGHDNPIYAINYDADLAAAANILNDDSRAPYGELNIDGEGFTDIDGIAWGDRYKFTSTTAPVTLGSSWTYNVQNTVPYVKEWIAGDLTPTHTKDATMGLVQTQTIAQQDGGGGRDPNYHDISVLWGKTSDPVTNPGGNGYTAQCAYLMPCQNEWAYQANADSIGPAISNNNARLTWRTQWGFIGQTTYVKNDGSGATPPGYPKKSYSLYVVLGTHKSSPVEAQVTQVETVQSLTLTAATGVVITNGPAGITRADNVTYSPAGYDHIYGALAFVAVGNRLDANVAVGAGTLKKPLFLIHNYTGGAPQVKLGGATLSADIDYFASLRPSANELWITLNRDLIGATNRIEVGIPSASPRASDFNGDGKSDLLLQNAAGDIAIWTMDGFAITAGAIVATPGTAWKVAATGDFNNDGKADIILQNTSTGDVAEWQMNGSTIIAGAVLGTPGTAWKVVATGDFNGDLKSDLLLQNNGTGDIAMWLVNGLVIGSGGVVASPGTSWKVVGTGDFNADGKSDILLQNTGTGDVAEWQMNGTAIIAGAVLGSGGAAWNVVGTDDLNGDGKTDIVLQNSGSRDVAVWIINDLAISAGAVVGTPGGTYAVLGTADYNGDGRADILLRDSSGTIAQWQLNPAGTAISAGGVVASPGSTWMPIVK
ncbi:MAG: VCBS repeat-containing protein [Acidobacteriota bacterium]|nr:VCBS repeat-containing protein [Acidobacteriota bacterium]